MHIGILQTGHVHDALVDENGDYDAIFARFLGGRGFRFTNYPVVDGVFPEGPEAAEGWLVTGSKFGAYEDLPWIPPLEALIREIHDRGIPMVGVCFGHQIIAQALGGRVEKFGGGWSVGTTDYRIGDDTYALNAWHQDQVTEVPPGARVVGGNDFCANAALVYGDRAFTVQPHPEIDRRYLTGLLEVRAPGVVPEDRRRAALDRIDAPTDSGRMADMIERFFKERTLA